MFEHATVLEELAFRSCRATDERLGSSSSHLTDENPVKMQQAEDGQRLIANAIHDQIASVCTDHLEQSHDRSHARAVDQTEAGKVDDHLRRPLFAYLADERSELDNRERV